MQAGGQGLLKRILAIVHFHGHGEEKTEDKDVNVRLEVLRRDGKWSLCVEKCLELCCGLNLQ